MSLRIICLAALVAHCNDYCLNAAGQMPMVEEYLTEGRISAYQKDAISYLEQNPKAPLSPRLAHDLYMVATITGNEQVAKKARRSLLFDYPNSLQTNYLIRGWRSDEEKMRKILSEEADRVSEEEAGFPARYCRCILLALKIHGPKLLADTSLRLRILHGIARFFD